MVFFLIRKASEQKLQILTDDLDKANNGFLVAKSQFEQQSSSLENQLTNSQNLNEKLEQELSNSQLNLNQEFSNLQSQILDLKNNNSNLNVQIKNLEGEKKSFQLKLSEMDRLKNEKTNLGIFLENTFFFFYLLLRFM